MITTFDHNINGSFYLWLDNILLTKGAAFTNYTGIMMPTQTEAYPNLNVYQSPHSQFVYDASVPNAILPSGIITPTGFVAQTGSDLVIDYPNGRVLTSATYQSVSGSYAFKDVNLYFTDESEHHLLFENKFYLRPIDNQNPTGFNTNEKSYPAIYIQYNPGQNQLLSFDGLNSTTMNIRAVLLADTKFLFDGVCGILRDTQSLYIPIFTSAQMPFNYYGDYKSGVFNYKNTAAIIQKDPNQMVFINNVKVSPFATRVNQEIAHKLKGGFIDFELLIYRFPTASP